MIRNGAERQKWWSWLVQLFFSTFPPPLLGRYCIRIFGSVIWTVSINRRLMYIIHQFLLLYTCHKLKNFIFRFYFLQFSPLCPLISRPIIPALQRHPPPTFSLGLFQSPLFCEGPSTPRYCSSMGHASRGLSALGESFIVSDNSASFWQECVYFLSANYGESKCPPLCCP